MSESGRLSRAHPDQLLVGLVSISDRASSGTYEDKGIPALQDWLDAALTEPAQFATRLIPDEPDQISATLIELVDEVGCDYARGDAGSWHKRDAGFWRTNASDQPAFRAYCDFVAPGGSYS